MSSQWKPQSYTDEYETALKAYAEKKHKQGENFTPPEVEEERPSKATDLMELLQKSLAQRVPRDARRQGRATPTDLAQNLRASHSPHLTRAPGPAPSRLPV